MPDEQVLSVESSATSSINNNTEIKADTAQPAEVSGETKPVETSPNVEQKKEEITKEVKTSKDDEPVFSRKDLALNVSRQVKQHEEKIRADARAEALKSLPPEQVRALQEEARAQAAQEYMNAQYKEQYDRAASYLAMKLGDGPKKYSDFEAKTKDLVDVVNPNTAMIFATIDNPEDVIYELANNPLQVAQFKLLTMDNPLRAAAGLKQLSDSIKTNKAAKSQPKPTQPLSQIQPSITSTDNGSMTVEDYRSLPSHKW